LNQTDQPENDSIEKISDTMFVHTVELAALGKYHYLKNRYQRKYFELKSKIQKKI
jgi:hypothetical protein